MIQNNQFGLFTNLWWKCYHFETSSGIENENLIWLIEGIYMVLILPPGLGEPYIVDPSPYLYPEIQIQILFGQDRFRFQNESTLKQSNENRQTVWREPNADWTRMNQIRMDATDFREKIYDDFNEQFLLCVEYFPYTSKKI